jgi:hypothetical protein
MEQHTKLSGQPVLCQLFSFIPPHLIDEAVQAHDADKYYKTLTTKKQLAFILYGVITRCHSLNSLCKNLLFLENKLMYIGIDKLPATSTLSDANINRSSDVFATLYNSLYSYYQKDLSDSYSCFLAQDEKIDPSKVILFDSTTISLFVDIFKGAGRNPVNGKKKGGLKVQAAMPLAGVVPELIYMHEARFNDKSFLGQLSYKAGTILIFDKGYVNYSQYQQWGEQGVFYLTRLNDNASYQVLESRKEDIINYAAGGVIKEEIILLQTAKDRALKARLITYKDPLTGKVLQFISNMFDCQGLSIALLYKSRWSIEVLFKRLKQNFELSYFFSDSAEGIKTQIWIALIAHLLFTVIHKRIKECEQFMTLVSIASNNMGSYVSLISIVTTKKLSSKERNIKNVQLTLFQLTRGGVFQKIQKSP